MVKSGRFCKYDFGPEKNMALYGRATPPAYDLARVNVPTVVFSGGNDRLADAKDIRRLVREELRPDILLDWIHIGEYAHLDFTWGMDAPEKVYRPVLEFLRRHHPVGSTVATR